MLRLLNWLHNLWLWLLLGLGRFRIPCSHLWRCLGLCRLLLLLLLLPLLLLLLLLPLLLLLLLLLLLDCCVGVGVGLCAGDSFHGSAQRRRHPHLRLLRLLRLLGYLRLRYLRLRLLGLLRCLLRLQLFCKLVASHCDGASCLALGPAHEEPLLPLLLLRRRVLDKPTLLGLRLRLWLLGLLGLATRGRKSMRRLGGRHRGSLLLLLLGLSTRSRERVRGLGGRHRRGLLLLLGLPARGGQGVEGLGQRGWAPDGGGHGRRHLPGGG